MYKYLTQDILLSSLLNSFFPCPNNLKLVALYVFKILINNVFRL